MVEPPVVVLGATGGQGHAVTEALLARSTKVRAVVRDPRSAGARRLAERGVEVLAGSLDDAEALTAAMRGTAAGFAFTTPFEAGIEAEVAQGRAIIVAAGRAQLPHLVFSSVAGAGEQTAIPHFESKARIEGDLRRSGLPHTVLAPTYFYDNALGGVDRIRAGVLDLPLPPDRQLQQIDRGDFGRFAAAVLLDPGSYSGRRIELAGDAPTPAEMTAALGRALGREVDYNQVPLAAIGNPDMLAMWTFLNGPGYQVDLPALHAAAPHLTWTSFADWAARTFAA
ncbi:NmrA/HSCARG family protein [Amycolatopsis sp. NPDC023774]|uniref:NmrA/HSCARG family protein n=1 Tax=Amycolatopsis sp. NPDC023774 TaxID=3155015 RepID=UPI0033EBA1CC